MGREETFKKEVITKSDGRYLIFYDFSPESVPKEVNQQKDEERN